ncbi:ABC transporter permease [Mycoplasma marinum]|uniref:Uncharacterized protein n=1 Tax=Mycoplasma marinum TaxID=1937190 RepID=A0A4R0XSN0_9MOLU|nr:ABC-2 transporter permease [Mycoplasma marinum]TCG11891.1 hypothetical protein C4B24_00650 [Mycoplasma marinum]
MSKIYKIYTKSLLKDKLFWFLSLFSFICALTIILIIHKVTRVHNGEIKSVYDSYLVQGFTYNISDSKMLIFIIALFILVTCFSIIVAFKVFGRGWSNILLISKVKNRKDIILGKIFSIITVCAIFALSIFLALFVSSLFNETNKKINFDISIAFIVLPTLFFIVLTFTLICSILFYLLGLAKSVFPVILIFVLLPGVSFIFQALNGDYRTSANSIGNNRYVGLKFLNKDTKDSNLEIITTDKRSYEKLMNSSLYRTNVKLSYTDLLSATISTMLPSSIYSKNSIKYTNGFYNIISHSTFEKVGKPIDFANINILKKNQTKAEQFALLTNNKEIPSLSSLSQSLIYQENYGDKFRELGEEIKMPANALSNEELVNKMSGIIAKIKGINQLDWSNLPILFNLLMTPIKGDMSPNFMLAIKTVEDKKKYMTKFYANSIFNPSEKPNIDWNKVSFKKTKSNGKTKFILTNETNKEIKFVEYDDKKLLINEDTLMGTTNAEELLSLLIYSNFVSHRKNGLNKIKTTYNKLDLPIISNINRIPREFDYKTGKIIDKNPKVDKHFTSGDGGPINSNVKTKGPNYKPMVKTTQGPEPKIITYPSLTLVSKEQLNKLHDLNSYKLTNSYPPIWYGWLFLFSISLLCFASLVAISRKREIKD